MPPSAWLALGVVALAVIAVARGWEVRATLLGAALIIGTIAGNPAEGRAHTFLNTFAAERFVLPICSAMGFAFALRETGCDRALVRLLLAPLARGGLFLIPGVVLVGCAVNVPVISQASASVCLGAVAVPLLRAAGFRPATVGATLLLGVSIGGELLNPGAPELASIRDQVGGRTSEIVPKVLPLLLTSLAAAVPLYWLLTVRAERKLGVTPIETPEIEVPFTPRDWPRAMVPLVPLTLLFLLGPPGNVLPVPTHWLVPVSDTPDPRVGARLVALAMLAGVAAAALARPAKARDCLPAFFTGAGHGFATIVSLIVTATAFGKAVELAGLGAALGQLLTDNPGLIWPAAALVPFGFALVSGSGMASTQSLFKSFAAPALAAGLDVAEVGAVVAVSAAAGRTMSPVAAVVLTCASLSGSTPGALVRRVALPLMGASSRWWG